MTITRRPTIRTATIALCMGLSLLAGACATGAPASAPPSGLPSWQADMLSRVNDARTGAGLAPLALCASLGRAAQNHSQDQANTNLMTHAGSDGSGLGTRADRAGYAGWRSLGENVAAGQPDAPSVISAWMNSSGHRANILGGYTHVGFGMAISARGVPYWTQDFGAGGTC